MTRPCQDECSTPSRSTAGHILASTFRRIIPGKVRTAKRRALLQPREGRGIGAAVDGGRGRSGRQVALPKMPRGAAQHVAVGDQRSDHIFVRLCLLHHELVSYPYPAIFLLVIGRGNAERVGFLWRDGHQSPGASAAVHEPAPAASRRGRAPHGGVPGDQRRLRLPHPLCTTNRTAVAGWVARAVCSLRVPFGRCYAPHHNAENGPS